MSPGQPFSFAALLPQGMGMEMALVWLAALAAFFAVMGVGFSFMERDYLGPRLKSVRARRDKLRQEMLAPRRRHRHEGTLHLMQLFIKKMKLLKDEKAENFAMLLNAAGFRSKDAVIIYVLVRLLAPIGALIVAWLLFYLALMNPSIPKASPILGIFIVLACGVKLPSIVVLNRRGKRWHKILLAIPDTLDLMMICAEAGLSLSAALDRVANELGRSYPDMAYELGMTSVELGFLPDRKKALENLARRVDIPEIRGIVNVLAQTEKYGTPVAQAMRVLAAEYRTQRMLRAEQKAARLPAIMTVPMILFILPCLFIIILTPAIVQLMDAM